MPLNRHEKIYRKLSVAVNQVRFALKEADPDTLMSLSQTHEAVIQDLQAADISGDRAFLEEVQALSRQVSEIITEIQQCQQGISAQIKQISDGRRLVAAYVT